VRGTLLLTRAEGAALDALTGALLAGALARFTGASSSWAAAGLLFGLVVGLRWTTARAARAIESSRPAVKHALTAWLEGAGGSLRPQLEAWLAKRIRVPFLNAGLVRVGVAAALCILARGPSPSPIVASCAPQAPMLPARSRSEFRSSRPRTPACRRRRHPSRRSRPSAGAS